MFFMSMSWVGAILAPGQKRKVQFGKINQKEKVENFHGNFTE
jgi:hypothetical protein